jgi:hypothetical protein
MSGPLATEVVLPIALTPDDELRRELVDWSFVVKEGGRHGFGGRTEPA